MTGNNVKSKTRRKSFDDKNKSSKSKAKIYIGPSPTSKAIDDALVAASGSSFISCRVDDSNIRGRYFSC